MKPRPLSLLVVGKVTDPKAIIKAFEKCGYYSPCSIHIALSSAEAMQKVKGTPHMFEHILVCLDEDDLESQATAIFLHILAEKDVQNVVVVDPLLATNHLDVRAGKNGHHIPKFIHLPFVDFKLSDASDTETLPDQVDWSTLATFIGHLDLEDHILKHWDTNPSG